MPKEEKLDIEKIKRKLKPSYADYAKALLANVLTAKDEEKPCTKEELNKIAERAYKNIGGEESYVDTPENTYLPILGDFILCNESTRLHYTVISRQLESLKNLVYTSHFTIQTLESLYINSDNKEQLLIEMKKLIDKSGDFNPLKNVNDTVKHIKTLTAFSYLSASAWNYFVYVLGEELKYRKLHYTYDVDGLIKLFSSLIHKVNTQIDNFLILKELDDEYIKEAKSQLLNAEIVLNEIINYEISDEAAFMIESIVARILDRPITTMNSSFGVILFSIVTDEYARFKDMLDKKTV